MNFGWEDERERLLRFMKIPPKRKLELLQQMNEFTRKFFSKRQKKIFWRLRQI
jgi:uncharacterized FlaG/YvyC family protein